MSLATVRRLILTFVAICVILPILLLAAGWAKPGIIVWGFGAALLALNVLRWVIRQEALRQEQSLREQRVEMARTVYVELFDEDGRPLPKPEADRRLAEAHAKAGPRDTIIPLAEPPHRKAETGR